MSHVGVCIGKYDKITKYETEISSRYIQIAKSKFKFKDESKGSIFNGNNSQTFDVKKIRKRSFQAVEKWPRVSILLPPDSFINVEICTPCQFSTIVIITVYRVLPYPSSHDPNKLKFIIYYYIFKSLYITGFLVLRKKNLKTSRLNVTWNHFPNVIPFKDIWPVI